MVNTIREYGYDVCVAAVWISASVDICVYVCVCVDKFYNEIKEHTHTQPTHYHWHIPTRALSMARGYGKNAGSSLKPSLARSRTMLSPFAISVVARRQK